MQVVFCGCCCPLVEGCSVGLPTGRCFSRGSLAAPGWFTVLLAVYGTARSFVIFPFVDSLVMADVRSDVWSSVGLVWRDTDGLLDVFLLGVFGMGIPDLGEVGAGF